MAPRYAHQRFARCNPNCINGAKGLQDAYILEPVPLPAAVWLMLSALGGLTAMVRPRRVGRESRLTSRLSLPVAPADGSARRPAGAFG